VRHVVVYRDGVAYFEREGLVKGARVGFRARSGSVSDLLATLAVSERAARDPAAGRASLVRSVDLDARSDDDAREGAQTVLLSLDGGTHDLDVGYVAESPIWKPSYRLVLHAGGLASLQIWGVVENASGEDWKDVGLSLVAGAPIAYASDLDATVIPTRPTVTDRGRPTMAVPRSESSYGYKSDGNAMMQSATTISQTVASRSETPMLAGMRDARRANVRTLVASADMSPGRAVVNLTMQGGSTRYDVALPVTIPDQGASMVFVVEDPAQGDQVLLFAPDDSVPEASSHPFRAVRFDNRTGGLLESGPIALFDDRSFLGQGVVESLRPGATGTVPIAIEHDVTVTHEQRTDEVTGSLTDAPLGGLTLARSQVTRTTYHLRSDLDRATSVLLRQPRKSGTRLRTPPAGVTENASLGVALIPASVPAQGTADVEVDETAPVETAVDWLAPTADMAVKAFLGDPKSDPEAVRRLTAAWSVRTDLLKLEEERSSLRLASYDLAREEQSGKRPPIEAKIAANARRMADVDTQLSALKLRLEHLLAEVRLRPGA
jgi:hypothetical protein